MLACNTSWLMNELRFWFYFRSLMYHTGSPNPQLSKVGRDLNLSPWFSKCSPWASSIDHSGNLLEMQVLGPLQTDCIRNSWGARIVLGFNKSSQCSEVP